MRPRVLIVGGGIGGLSLAGFLAREAPSTEVILVERRSSFSPVGAGITLSGNALRLLDRLGIVDQLRARGVPLERMVLANARGQQLGETRLGSSGPLRGSDEWSDVVVAIHRADLHETLVSSLPAECDVRLGVEPKSFESTGRGVTVSLATRHSESLPECVDLVVGADGAGSRVRQEIPESDRVTARYAGYTCWRGVVDLESAAVSSERTAWELWGAGKRFGVVPIGGGRVYFYACVNAPEKSARFANLEPSQVADLFSDLGGPVPEVLSALEPDHQLHHDDLADVWLPKWSHGAMVVIGDAAHASTPNLGQGAAQAIEDAALLAQLAATTPTIEPDRGESPIADRLSTFETLRRPRVDTLQTRARRIGAAGQLRFAPMRWVRDLAMRLTPDSVLARQVTEVVDGGVRWNHVLNDSAS